MNITNLLQKDLFRRESLSIRMVIPKRMLPPTASVGMPQLPQRPFIPLVLEILNYAVTSNPVNKLQYFGRLQLGTYDRVQVIRHHDVSEYQKARGTSCLIERGANDLFD